MPSRRRPGAGFRSRPSSRGLRSSSWRRRCVMARGSPARERQHAGPACARCGRSVWWPALISDRARRVTMTARRTLASIFVVALALHAFAAPPAAQPAGTLLVGLVAEPVNLDPAQVTDLNSNRVGRRVVETLVTFPDESTQVVPGPRRVVDDLEGRAPVHLQAPERRQVPRRHAVQRRGGQVLHRAADQSGAPGQQARQVSLRQLLLRQRQGGRGAERRATSPSCSRSRARRFSPS